MVANPDNVVAFAPVEISLDPMNPNQINPGDGLNGGLNPINPPTPDDPQDPNPIEIHNYPYLIITTNDLIHSVRRLAALKRQKGYEVKIVTIDDVMSDPHLSEGDIIKRQDGSYCVSYGDGAGFLRQYLKNAFKYWGTRYVFLVGDSLPYRTVDMAHTSGPIIENIPTDLYLSDLNGDWTTPLNVRKIDYSLDLYVGRLLSKTEQENSN